ncbi:TraR/DksA C4-type zinc finger protein [Shewanella algae]|jgi:phage/conjugal plasmid C-4 type zinc finger TraR family protein|uniref:TraR/DksA C4-type zinc finger protein n=2 Tax=Shewanella TaxID=22 RepID=UPI001F0BE1E8|nr:TraR/DksA C4-type zinc finger protein [Shewanella algae]
MMDVFDHASDKENQDRENAIANVVNATRSASMGTGICLDCLEPVEPERLSVAPYAVRCISCQQDQEKRYQMMTGGHRA